MSNHTVTFSDAVWNWAAKEGKKSGTGPATFIRNVVSEAIVRESSGIRDSQPEPQRLPSGKAVHQDCYKQMARDFQRKYPGRELPWVTPYTARLRTICPKCLGHVNEGDDISMTTMSEWE